MSNSLNSVQIIGNMTANSELKKTKSGTSVCQVGVATNRKWKDSNGTDNEEVEYHNIVCWGKLAEIVCQYLAKGSKVYFQGRLKTECWEKEGKKNYKTTIVAENMIMLGSKPQTAQPAPQETVGEEVNLPWEQ